MECDATAWLVTSLIPTLIATLASTLSTTLELSENRQFLESLSENDFDMFRILPNCAKMRKGTIRKLSDEIVFCSDYSKREKLSESLSGHKILPVTITFSTLDPS